MSWEIFLGIAALVSFIAGVATPLLKLNTSITKLAETTKTLDQAVSKITDDNEKGHARIWAHNDEQDEFIQGLEKRVTAVEVRLDDNVINKHENRITKLETRVDGIEHNMDRK